MALHKSAKEGELLLLKKEIEDLLENGASHEDVGNFLGNTDAFHLTPLHYAVKYQNVDIVRYLLKNGADVTKKGENGTTCLHYAARYYEQDESKTGEGIIDLLLAARNSEVNCQDDDGATPLHYACLKDNYKIVRRLLSVRNINIEAKDKWQTSPLLAACSVGSISIVKRLLKNGARVDVIDEARNTPLHLACSGGHEEVVLELFDETERQFGFSALSNMLLSQNREGQSSLHVAVLASHFHVIKTLLERGANVNQLMLEAETPLHISAVTGHLAISRLLLAHDALIDAKNEEGRTPLHKAAVFGKSQVVELLLEKSADVNIQGRFKVTALMLAASSNYPDIVSILLQHKANISGKDYEGRNALHLAASGNAVDALKVLLNDKQIERILNEEDKDGNTALHISCAKGFDEITKLLLDANVNVTPRNNMEQTPAHLASLNGRSEVVSELLEKDASTINDIDKKGNAALHLAALGGHIATIEVLLQAGASINDRNTKLLTPLDCAARCGQVGAAKVLLERKASVEPMYKHGMTPLLHASLHGHGKMVELLLQSCDISLTDESGRNCLDLAIDHGKTESAAAILHHRDWRTAMRNKTIEEGQVTTPMRKLIRKMPDICIMALNNCVGKSDATADHYDYHIKLEYEFLDDIYNDWPCDAVRMDSDKGKGRGHLLTKQQIKNQLKKKNNHSLSIMVTSKREQLLSHPLVMNLLSWKWSAYGAYLYYLKLFLYCIFLLFLTGYIMLTAPLRFPYRNENCQLLEKDVKDSLQKKIFLDCGKFIILGLAFLHLWFELFQAIAQRTEYFSLENALEIIVYCLAIINVADDELKLPIKFSCTIYQQTIGSYAIFLSWMNLVLFLRKIPKFGIYIVMFGYVVRTFLQFFLVFVLMIIAFALGFYILFADIEELGSFRTPMKSMIKTLVMMSGELDFGSVFDNTFNPPPASWPLFLMFVILLTIILMNLLVGLAVDDIQEVQKQAVLNRMKMQIDLALDAEKSLPEKFRKMFIAKEQIIYPNHKWTLCARIRQSDDLIKSLENTFKSEKSALDHLKEQTKGLEMKNIDLKKQITSISNQVEKLDSLELKLNEMIDILNDKQTRKK